MVHEKDNEEIDCESLYGGEEEAEEDDKAKTTDEEPAAVQLEDAQSQYAGDRTGDSTYTASDSHYD